MLDTLSTTYDYKNPCGTLNNQTKDLAPVIHQSDDHDPPKRINYGENLIMTCATWCLIRCEISCNIETFQADDRCNKVHYTRNFSNSFMPSTSHFHRGLLYFTNALLWSLRPMFHAVSPKMFHAFLRTAANQCMNFCNGLWPASLPSVSISCNWFTGSKLPLYVANNDDDILHMQGSLHPSCQTVSAVDFPVLWFRPSFAVNSPQHGLWACLHHNLSSQITTQTRW